MIHTTLRFVAALRTIGALCVLVLCLGSCRDEPTKVEEGRAQFTVAIAGLPTGVDGDVRITGPGGYARTIGTTQVLGDLLPGRYQLRANDVRLNGFTWSGAPASLEATFAAGDTVFAGVVYTIATGALRITINGLPSGAAGSVRIVGPGGVARTATNTVTFGDLPPGEYLVTTDSVNTGGTGWRGSNPIVVQVPASLSPAAVQITYRNVTGVFAFVAANVPSDAVPTARVQGPLLFDRTVRSGDVLRVPVGSYVVTPLPAFRQLTVLPRLFVPVVRSVTRAIGDQLADSIVVPYAASAAPVNVILDNVVVTQAVQRSDNGIPLVAGREALLRAFVIADREGVTPPRGVVRLYEGANQIGTLQLTPPTGPLPLVTREDMDSAAYTTRLAPDLIRNSLRLVVDIDPDSTIGEPQRGDNVWPTGGVARALTTTSVPTFTVRFVPIVIGGQMGTVTEARQNAMLAAARALWPLAQVESEVRAPFISSVSALTPTDANASWTTVLNELRALRVADGAPNSVHYYGVVRVPYDSGLFGLGLIGSPTAIGWDRENAPAIAAHEWGHNFGRVHTPCGDPPSPDPSYPILGGFTASIGWDVRSNRIMPPTTPDVMGYCANPWVSEFSYTKALAFRQANASTRLTALRARSRAEPTDTSESDALLVWGRVQNGRLILEPVRPMRSYVATIETASERATASEMHAATHIVELLDASGTVLYRTTTATDAVDHVRDTHVFALAVPRTIGAVAIRVSDIRSPLIAVQRLLP
ncbi:MAG: hypothetical protein IBJ03_00375 [Gemmatimonadaceae bacterium]|nr:hypothetical protein [Gemmatimonadaceae bacterium]